MDGGDPADEARVGLRANGRRGGEVSTVEDEVASTQGRQPSTERAATGRLTSRLVAAFAATVIEIEHPDGTWQVRGLGDGGCRAGVGPLVWPVDGIDALHVITACNPGSVPLSAERNARRQRRLGQQLKSLAATCWPAVGRSEDGSWAEPSFAVVGLDRDVAAAIGLRAGQLAIFELADELLVVRCRDTEVVRRRPAVLQTLATP